MKVPLRKAFRKRSNYQIALISEILAPLLKLWAQAKTSKGRRPKREWKKVLLLGANHIGDILYRTCALQDLAEGMPNCQFDIIAPAPADEVLARNPYIRKIHRFETPFKSRGSDFNDLRNEGYDAAICYDTGGYLSSLRLAVELGIPERVGYVHKGFSGLVTHPIDIQYPQAFPAYFRDLVAQVTNGPEISGLSPNVYVDEHDKIRADEIIERLELGERQLMAAFLTSRQPLGVFPAERLGAAIQEIELSAPQIKTVLLGAASDLALLNSIKARFSLRAEVIAGSMPLLVLVCFLRRCKLVLSTDSGPRHLSNAAGIPVFFYRNINFDAIEAGRYAQGDHDLMPVDLSCVDPSDQDDVFRRFQPQQTARAILDYLKSHDL